MNLIRLVVGLFLFLVNMHLAHGASLNQRLAELGHPNTATCRITSSSKGLGSFPVVQFRSRENQAEDRAESIELLGLMAEALVKADLDYIGFEARKDWDTCRDRDPRYIFWRDYNGDWRSMGRSPVKYLAKHEEELAPELRGTADEAFVLFSLGLVEQRLNRIPASVEKFGRAYELIAEGEDPHGIKAKMLMPLIHYHFSDDGDEAAGQTYLDAYAPLAAETPGKDNYLPLIKVAPVYPRRAFAAGVQGFVLLEFTVTRTGRVVDPFVVASEPPGTFDQAAIDAAGSFRYIPKVVDGRAVDVSGVRNRITFEIR